jgi:hypothetical protein
MYVCLIALHTTPGAKIVQSIHVAIVRCTNLWGRVPHCRRETDITRLEETHAIGILVKSIFTIALILKEFQIQLWGAFITVITIILQT